MKVEAGKWYMDETGSIQGPMQVHKNFVFPVPLFSTPSSLFLWFEDGSSVGLFGCRRLVREVKIECLGSSYQTRHIGTISIQERVD